MGKTVRLIALGMLAGLALLMSACSPQTDTTDPLSDYAVDVKVPFSTKSPSAVEAQPTAGVQYTISTRPAEKILGWMNETLDASAEDAYTELALGSIGTAVKNLQKRLIELGYMTGTANGSFDQATALAVKRFEAAYGRAQTGIATRILQVYLFSDNAKTNSGDALSAQTTVRAGAYAQLQRGDMGTGVTNLQNRLIELGYLAGAANGVFDANTENAVKEFEAAYGKQRTGIATIGLQTYLFSTNALRAGVTLTPTRAVVTYTPTPSPTPEPAYAALQYGSKGAGVSALQSRLKALGYYTGKVDGVYGNATVRAIQAFEAAYGQNQTGVASSILQYYLFSDSARAYTDATPTPSPTPTPAAYSTLSKGSYGDEVARMQARLIQLGYLSGKADGYFGNATADAVRAFEARYGRTQSGVATAALQQYLFAQDALSYTSQTNVQAEYTVLSEGAYGANVYALQTRLIELQYMSATADGYYGQSTVDAVKAFEAAYGRAQTGIASVSLQETLHSSGAKSAAVTIPTGDSYSRLKKGDKGDDVARLQLRLIELGYLTGTVDGYYGDGTADAVTAFAAAYGQANSGVATAALQSYLFSDTALSNPQDDVAVSYATLESGDEGSAVKNLQLRLRELGYLTSSADGRFGDATLSAVKAFQKAINLKQTGVATPALQKELFASTAPAQKSASTVTVVNRTAYVSADQTYVYASASDASAIGTLYKDTQVSILRTYGVWAEIQNDAGSIAYAKLADFTYSSPAASGEGGLSGNIVTVNAAAKVSADQIVVYAYPSEASEMLGVLSKGAVVTWNRTNGSWAEITNSGGSKGYVYAQYLALADSSQASGGNDNAAQSAYKDLEPGNTGASVKNMQRRLKELGYFSGDIGGNYLTKTTAAVKAFQAALGVSQTGKASAALQEVLFSSAAPAYGASAQSGNYTYQTLTLGSTGEDVGELQMKLISLGYLNAADVAFSTFDAATRSAVIDLQLAMGATGADGVATPELQAFLATEASAALAR